MNTTIATREMFVEGEYPKFYMKSVVGKTSKANPYIYTVLSDTPSQLYYTGYNRVRSNLTKITKALQSTPGARENLILHYKQYEWLDLTENPAEGELVTLALVRIKQDPSQFDKFIDMLRDTKGMDVIVTTLTEGELRCTLHLYTY